MEANQSSLVSIMVLRFLCHIKWGHCLISQLSSRHPSSLPFGQAADYGFIPTQCPLLSLSAYPCLLLQVHNQLIHLLQFCPPCPLTHQMFIGSELCPSSLKYNPV